MWGFHGSREKHAQRDSIPPHETTGKPASLVSDGAHSGARNQLDDTWLSQLVEVWPVLSDDLKREILALAGLRADDVDDLNDVTTALPLSAVPKSGELSGARKPEQEQRPDVLGVALARTPARGNFPTR